MRENNRILKINKRRGREGVGEREREGEKKKERRGYLGWSAQRCFPLLVLFFLSFFVFCFFFLLLLCLLGLRRLLDFLCRCFLHAASNVNIYASPSSLLHYLLFYLLSLLVLYSHSNKPFQLAFACCGLRWRSVLALLFLLLLISL